jgi:hypothetical protein
MSEKFARVLSILLHPVWMPAFAFLILLNTSTFFQLVIPQQMLMAIYIVIGLSTLLIPLLSVAFLYHKGIIHSLEMTERRERNIPYLINITCMLLAFYMLTQLRAPFLFGKIMLGASIALAITFIINLKWKISIHMIGIGGICGVLFGLSELLYEDSHASLLISLLFSGLLGTARLSLNAHMPSQVYSGWVLGFMCEYILMSS